MASVQKLEQGEYTQNVLPSVFLTRSSHGSGGVHHSHPLECLPQLVYRLWGSVQLPVLMGASQFCGIAPSSTLVPHTEAARGPTRHPKPYGRGVVAHPAMRASPLVSGLRGPS